MRVQVQSWRELPQGRGEELGHGFDKYYESGADSFYIPSGRMPIFDRECFPGWRGEKEGVGYCYYWIVATPCCPFLPVGAVCRIYTDEGVEVGEL
jgi:hypothetical protein